MSCIRRIGRIENSSVKIPCKKKEVSTLYIETNKDHVAMQDRSNKAVQKRLKNSCNKTIDDITVLDTRKRTWLSELLKSIRSA